MGFLMNRLRIFHEAPDLVRLYPEVLAVAISAVVMFLYHLFGVMDFWGDSYHNIIISRMTADNNWVYSDYKGREVVWLPAYRYLITIFMAISGHFGLETAWILNSSLGLSLVWLVTAFMRTFTPAENAFLAGIGLGTSPWFIAYSHQNMPEIFCAFLLFTIVWVWQKKRDALLIPLGFMVVLSRNETTLLAAAAGVLMLYYKAWRPAFLLGLGALSGLGLWMYWCFDQTGDMFFWLKEHMAGSARDADFNRSARSIWPAILTFLIIFPFSFLIFKVQNKTFLKIWSISQYRFALVISSIHVFFIMITQFKYYSYPDPRYYLLTLPFMFVSLMALIGVDRKNLLFISIISLINIVGHAFLFQVKGVEFEQRFEAGYYLREFEKYKAGSMFWIDSPEVWYMSGLSSRSLISSSQITKAVKPGGTPGRSEVVAYCVDKNINTMAWFRASFTNTAELFPELASSDTLNLPEGKLVRFFRSQNSGVPVTGIRMIDVHIKQWANNRPEISLIRILPPSKAEIGRLP